MEKDLVSIIMPSYNTARHIAQSIQSVQNQTYRNWELIIVDDCSTDDTDEVVGQFHDDRIRYIKNDINSGAAISRNKALCEAKGRWVAFLDSDDLWISTKLETQIKFMEEHDYHFSYTKYREIDENSNILNRIISGPKKITKRNMFNYCWVGCLTVMYDARRIGLIQIENLKKNNDYAMWLKACKKETCYLCPEILASYRKRAGSISNHSKTSLIKYHYYLFRYGEKMNRIKSAYFTCKNLCFGIWKKLRYVKREK